MNITVAKGIKTSKTLQSGYLEPMNCISLNFYYNPKRQLQIFSKAEFNKPLLSLKHDVKKLLDKSKSSFLACDKFILERNFILKNGEEIKINPITPPIIPGIPKIKRIFGSVSLPHKSCELEPGKIFSFNYFLNILFF